MSTSPCTSCGPTAADALSNAIAIRVARKANDVVKSQGEAAVDLLRGAAQLAQTQPRSDGRIDLRA